MTKQNLGVDNRLFGSAGPFGPDDDGDFAVDGRKLAWLDSIKAALATDLTPDKLNTILAQLTAALANAGVSQTDIDNIVTAIRGYVDGIENPALSDVYYAIGLMLSPSSIGLTEAQVRAIVQESMQGFANFATHEDVQKVAAELQSHIGSDAALYQNMYKAIMSEVQETISGTVPAYDMNNPEVVSDAAGALVAVDLGKTWTAPTGGKLVMIYKATLLGVSPTVTKNGTVIFSDGLGILGLTNGEPVTERITVGDVIVISGSLGLLTSFNATFYPSIVVQP